VRNVAKPETKNAFLGALRASAAANRREGLYKLWILTQLGEQYKHTAICCLTSYRGITIMWCVSEVVRLRIRDFCDIRMGHTFRRRLTTVSDGNVMVMQPRNISPEGLVTFGNGEPVRTDVSVSKPLQLHDILIVNRGRFSAAVFDFAESDTWIVPSSILVLSLKAKSVLPEYMVCYFNSSNGQKLLRRHCERSTVPFISARNLANIDIPVPPLDRQKALIAFEEAVAKYARLSNRKQELFRHILSHELAPEEQSMRRRAQ